MLGYMCIGNEEIRSRKNIRYTTMLTSIRTVGSWLLLDLFSVPFVYI